MCFYPSHITALTSGSSSPGRYPRLRGHREASQVMYIAYRTFYRHVECGTQQRAWRLMGKRRRRSTPFSPLSPWQPSRASCSCAADPTGPNKSWLTAYCNPASLRPALAALFGSRVPNSDGKLMKGHTVSRRCHIRNRHCLARLTSCTKEALKRCTPNIPSWQAALYPENNRKPCIHGANLIT